ncbi:hypothetical protein DFJ73DRAFT_835243 [Zopfochytrium polystomum]|nr:hypothetical protein DFJ73DRAFT_835243 [Zopfochytrium polystomum]
MLEKARYGGKRGRTGSAFVESELGCGGGLLDSVPFISFFFFFGLFSLALTTVSAFSSAFFILALFSDSSLALPLSLSLSLSGSFFFFYLLAIFFFGPSPCFGFFLFLSFFFFYFFLSFVRFRAFFKKGLLGLND